MQIKPAARFLVGGGKKKKLARTLWRVDVGPVQGVDNARVIFPEGQVLDNVSHVDLRGDEKWIG